VSCIFCRIAGGEIEADVIHADEACVAFRDLNPQAPVHVLIIPRRHIESIDRLADEDADILGRMGVVARDLARREGIDAAGYRLVLNCNEAGGQTVFHLHMHLLGGRDFGWPPG
jgi:histidine triad (HIT) family protein